MSSCSELRSATIAQSRCGSIMCSYFVYSKSTRDKTDNGRPIQIVYDIYLFVKLSKSCVATHTVQFHPWSICCTQSTSTKSSRTCSELSLQTAVLNNLTSASCTHKPHRISAEVMLVSTVISMQTVILRALYQCLSLFTTHQPPLSKSPLRMKDGILILDGSLASS